MNKHELYEFLDSKNIRYEVTEHKAVFSMEELTDVVLPYPEADAKNLFVRDDNTATVWIGTDDLIKLIEDYGTAVRRF